MKILEGGNDARLKVLKQNPFLKKFSGPAMFDYEVRF